MRIGHVTGEYPPMQGGVGAFTRELAIALRDLGHEIFVFTRREVGTRDDSGIAVTGSVGNRWGWDTLPALDRWAEASRLDVLNIQFQTAALDMHPAIHWTARQLREPKRQVITTFHDLRVPYLFPKAGPIRRWSVRRLAAWSSGVIATNQEDAETLQNRWDIQRTRWIPIGSNINPQRVNAADRASVRQGLGVGDKQLLISYFGFLNETKGALILVNALDQLVNSGIDAHLIMIGGRAGASDTTNREYGARVDEAVNKLGLSERIHWSGFVDDSAVSKLFYASDVTALPYLDGASLRRGTLMAALAHGRAIVTTLPIAREAEGAAEAVAANDPDALGQAIFGLWQDPSKRKTLEMKAAQVAEQFTWSRIAKQTVDFYREVLGQ